MTGTKDIVRTLSAGPEPTRTVQLEVYVESHFFCTVDKPMKTLAVGFIHETAVRNVELWKMVSFTIHWPWIRHFCGFVNLEGE